MKFRFTTFVLLIILLLQSCNKVDDISGENIPGYSPILLSAESASTFSRTYIPSGMYDEFKVHAVSETGSNKNAVMEGYEVKYVNNSWTYITDTQQLLYWDYKADRYLFTAGAPIESVTSISEAKMTLHLKNNLIESAMACEPLKIERTSSDFGKTVNLRFGYAHCRVCVAFVKNSSAETVISDITLTPDAAITTEADLNYSYNWDTATPSVATQVSAPITSSESFVYAPITIPAGTADAVVSATRYYCVPDPANASGWTISLKCDEELKSAPFVNSKKWESGKNYIYIFSLEEKTPKLIYVISQELTYFDCEDIVPGGEFSNADMTE